MTGIEADLKKINKYLKTAVKTVIQSMKSSFTLGHAA